MKANTILKTVTALATVTALINGPSPAYAARLTQLKDGFEPPNDDWSFGGDGASGGLFNNSSLARSGSWGSYIWTENFGEWGTMGRSVSITGWTSANRGQCSTTFWVNSDSDYYASVNVEIIDPVTWTYIALKRTNVGNEQGWVPVSVTNWVPPRSTVFVRIAVGTGLDDVLLWPQEQFAFIDDMTTSCIFE
jgi:hypothetical protein